MSNAEVSPHPRLQGGLPFRLAASVVTLLACVFAAWAMNWGWWWGLIGGIPFAAVAFLALTVAANSQAPPKPRRVAGLFIAGSFLSLLGALLQVRAGNTPLASFEFFLGAAGIAYSIYLLRSLSRATSHSRDETRGGSS